MRTRNSAQPLSIPCVDHFSRLPETVDFAPANVDEHLRADVEKYGAEVPRKKREKSSATQAKEMMYEVAGAKPVVVHDVPEKQYANLFDPAVASHSAAVLVKNLMDASKAARELMPSLQPHESAAFAYQIKNSPEVHAALQSELDKFGLTDDAKKKFFSTVWSLALDGSPANTQKQIAALRLLARGFGLGENAGKDADKPATLRIASIESGLEDMGLSPAVLASVPAADFTPEDAEREIEKESQEE